jgi:hypothetical protein
MALRWWRWRYKTIVHSSCQTLNNTLRSPVHIILSRLKNCWDEESDIALLHARCLWRICHILQSMEVLLRTFMCRGMLKNVPQISKNSKWDQWTVSGSNFFLNRPNFFDAAAIFGCRRWWETGNFFMWPYWSTMGRNWLLEELMPMQFYTAHTDAQVSRKRACG